MKLSHLKRDSEWWQEHADMYWKERDRKRKRFCLFMVWIKKKLESIKNDTKSRSTNKP